MAKMKHVVVEVGTFNSFKEKGTTMISSFSDSLALQQIKHNKIKCH